MVLWKSCWHEPDTILKFVAEYLISNSHPHCEIQLWPPESRQHAARYHACMHLNKFPHTSLEGSDYNFILILLKLLLYLIEHYAPDLKSYLWAPSSPSIPSAQVPLSSSHFGRGRLIPSLAERESRVPSILVEWKEEKGVREDAKEEKKAESKVDVGMSDRRKRARGSLPGLLE